MCNRQRLKGGPPRPQVKPNTVEPAGQSGTEARGTVEEDAPRRRGPHRAKTAELTSHVTACVTVAEVPAGSECTGYRRFGVQDLAIRAHTTCDRLEHGRFPNGDYVTAPVPPTAGNGHAGSTLISYVLYQYDHAHVTPPLVLAQFPDWGIEMSAGPLTHLVTEGHERCHQEKAVLKAAGLAPSTDLQADDTGARHPGRTGYCT